MSWFHAFVTAFELVAIVGLLYVAAMTILMCSTKKYGWILVLLVIVTLLAVLIHCC